MTLTEALLVIITGQAQAVARKSNPTRQFSWEGGRVVITSTFPTGGRQIEKSTYGPSWPDVFADDWEAVEK